MNCIWKIISCLEEKEGVIIYNIIPNDEIDEEDKELFNNKWVMKVINNYHREIDMIENYEIFKSPYCVKMPSKKINRSGTYKNNSWYVMEKYLGNLKNYFLYGKNNIDILVFEIISFIEFLHVEKNVVHGDVKPENILVNLKEDNMFKLIDYESLVKPTSVICKNNIRDGFYYYSLGCYDNKSFYSFRMDLEAFGIILWCLTLSDDYLYRFNWQYDSYDQYINIPDNCFYISYEIISYTYDKLNLLKKNSKEYKDEKIKKYFEIINELDWNTNTPNPEIYKKIKELFNYKKEN